MTSEELIAAGHALDLALRDTDRAAIQAARVRVLAAVRASLSAAGAKEAEVERGVASAEADIEKRIVEIGLWVAADGEVRTLREADLLAAGAAVAPGDGINTAVTKLRAALVRMGYPRAMISAHADRLVGAAQTALARDDASATETPEPPEAADPAAPAAPDEALPRLDEGLVAGIMRAHPAIASRNELLRVIRSALAGLGHTERAVDARSDDIKRWVREELRQRDEAARAVTWAAVTGIITAQPNIADAESLMAHVREGLLAQGASEAALAIKSGDLEAWVQKAVVDRQARGVASDAPAAHAETAAAEAEEAAPAETAAPETVGPAQNEDDTGSAQEATPQAAAAPSEHEPPVTAKAPRKIDGAPPHKPAEPATQAMRSTPPKLSREDAQALRMATLEVARENPLDGIERLQEKLTQKLFFKGWETAKIEAARAEIAAAARDAIHKKRQTLARETRGQTRSAPTADWPGGNGMASLVIVLLLAVAGGGYWLWSAPSGSDATRAAQSAAPVALVAAPAAPTPAPPQGPTLAQRRAEALDFDLRPSVFGGDINFIAKAPAGCGYRVERGEMTIFGYLVQGQVIGMNGQQLLREREAQIRMDERTQTAVVLIDHGTLGLAGALNFGRIFEDELRAKVQGAPVDERGRLGMLVTDFEDGQGRYVRTRVGLYLDSAGELEIKDVETEDLERILNELDHSTDLVTLSSVVIGPDWTPQGFAKSMQHIPVFRQPAIRDRAQEGLRQIRSQVAAGKCVASPSLNLTLRNFVGLRSLRLRGADRGIP